jgi:hypothetical protein
MDTQSPDTSRGLYQPWTMYEYVTAEILRQAKLVQEEEEKKQKKDHNEAKKEINNATKKQDWQYTRQICSFV